MAGIGCGVMTTKIQSGRALQEICIAWSRPQLALRNALFMVGAIVLASPAAAQQYTAPRTSFNQPDLQGTWNSVSLTTLERPPEYKTLIVPDADAEETARLREKNNQSNQAATDPASGAPTESRVVGYNRFWSDPRSTLGRVKGSYRSSWIIDPPNGRIPLSAAGKKLKAAADARLGYSDPEARPLPDRCIASIGRNGPPMTNGRYNNHIQIVQSPTHVAIHSEMMSNVRIVALNAPHLSPEIAPLFGDAVGRWEGETLVVESTNFSPYHAWQGQPALLTREAKVIERFTRVGDKELLYEFTVIDPTFYSQPWKGEMPLIMDGERSFEYACHEGNYAMTGILSGARVREAKGLPPEKEEAEGE